MLIKSARVENFASYKELDIDFSDKGLMLIHGNTGSGKSTICDIVPWILFGRTAKGGNADEILSWPGDKITKASINIETNNIQTQIVRTRGAKPKDNDLYYIDSDHFCNVRGKDLNDTQKLINQRLGIDYELYLSGAYFHEFSQTAQFFITTAKNRRSILEQLVDLSLAKTLQTNLSEAKKAIKADFAKLDPAITMNIINLRNDYETLKRETGRSEVWELAHKIAVQELDEQNKNFEAVKWFKNEKFAKAYFKWNDEYEIKIADYKAIIQDLNNKVMSGSYFNKWDKELRAAEKRHQDRKCDKCGSSIYHYSTLEDRQKYNREMDEQSRTVSRLSELESKLKQERLVENPHSVPLEMNRNAKNTYAEQLDKELAKVNPHLKTIDVYTKAQHKNEADKQKLEKEHTALVQKQSDLELLSDFTEVFRGEVIKTTIEGIQDKTNELLTQHFDSEVQIELTIEGADKVESLVMKDSNEAAYSQLSKGQRQILKLCFGIAVMKTVQNHHTINFEHIFLDEGLDGLDENFKLKAYGLLQSLALDYNSVFVVEHSSELKAQFENQMYIELTSEGSIVETR